VKEAKAKKGKEFDESDFKRISKLVNKTVADHQKSYYKKLEDEKKNPPPIKTKQSQNPNRTNER
jgi:hypothetical protein